MVRILFSASFPEAALARQTPGYSGAWEEFQFLFGPDGQAVDGWTVYDNLRETVTLECPAPNTLLITGEPMSVRRYRGRFTSQFGHVWTSHASIRHRHKIQQHEAQPWHYGLYPSHTHGTSLGFDELARMPRPHKPKLLSVLCSNKTMTPDHRQRLIFLDQLRTALGDQIDVFGRGIRDCLDKADAIHAYKYHIVLENDHADYFMTEKLPDAFLGWSFPIYAGGPAAGRLFPVGSFAAIDMNRPQEAVARVRTAIAQNEFERSQASIAAARDLVLRKYNLFAMQARFWREHLASADCTPVTLYPKRQRARLAMSHVRRLVKSQLQALIRGIRGKHMTACLERKASHETTKSCSMTVEKRATLSCMPAVCGVDKKLGRLDSRTTSSTRTGWIR